MPGALKLAVVSLADWFAKVTVPGPLTRVQRVVTVPDGCPSSETVPFRLADCETRIDEIHNELTLPAILRDGEKAKQLKAELMQQEEVLKALYEHWEEANELN